jgi:hypothetical protein
VWAAAADGSLSVCYDGSGAGQLDPAGWRVFKPEGGMKGERPSKQPGRAAVGCANAIIMWMLYMLLTGG